MQMLSTNNTKQLIKLFKYLINVTSPDGAVAMSSANGPVYTGFVSRYRLQPIASF